MVIVPFHPHIKKRWQLVDADQKQCCRDARLRVARRVTSGGGTIIKNCHVIIPASIQPILKEINDSFKDFHYVRHALAKGSFMMLKSQSRYVNFKARLIVIFQFSMEEFINLDSRFRLMNSRISSYDIARDAVFDTFDNGYSPWDDPLEFTDAVYELADFRVQMAYEELVGRLENLPHAISFEDDELDDDE